LDARQFAHQHYETAQTFVGDTPQSDDISLMAIKYLGKSDNSPYYRSLTLGNDVEEVIELTAFMNSICKDLNLDEMTTTYTTLAVEEAVVNVMKYAYPDREPSHILLEAQANDNALTFTLRDKGMPFDATQAAEVDVEQNAAQRIEGGLGIHLMRHYMDNISYKREDNENILIMQKLINK
jgi:anti-sigma regulatory factor (Ser/Thr protein kinase)